MQRRLAANAAAWLLCAVLGASLGACAKKTPPVARPLPPEPPAPTEVTPTPPPPPPAPAQQPAPAPAPKIAEDPFLARSLDEINRDSPLKPVFFDYNSSELNDEAVSSVRGNADLLRKYATWAVTIEGHCDERGTAEYNLALGERRAVSVRTYLVSLGIGADRIRIVSYGKEFPFDPAHTEEAWARNRRGHFVITGK